MSRTARLLIDAALLVAYVAANNPNATGIPIHEWLSIGVALAAAVHVALNWEWVGHAAKRLFGRLRAASKLDFVVDVVLFVAFVVVMLSGLLISKALLPAIGLKLAGGGIWRIAHKLSATIAFGALSLHFALHWRWMLGAVKALFSPKVGGATSAVAEGGELS